MSAIFRRLALAFLIVLATVNLAFAAQKLTDSQEKKALDWAVNNSLFTLYHEVTHLLIDQLDLPILGREEDAADAVASYRLLTEKGHAGDVAIGDAAYGWLLTGKEYGDKLIDADFYSDHSLDKQRAFQIVCYMVGKDHDTFHKIADDFHIDNARQDSCTYDWARLKISMRELMAPYSDKNHKPTKVKITYNTVTGDLKKAADAFKRSGVFEQVAHEVERDYAIDKPVTFVAKKCGEPNAFYNPDKVEIIYCYELMDDFLNMIKQDMPDENVEKVPVSEGLGRAG